MQIGSVISRDAIYAVLPTYDQAVNVLNWSPTKREYVTDFNSDVSVYFVDPTERSHYSTAYQITHGFRFNDVPAPTLRFKVSARVAGGTMDIQFRKNGNVVATWSGVSSTAYVSVGSVAIDVAPGDKIQVFTKSDSGTADVFTKDFRIVAGVVSLIEMDVT